MCNRDDNHFIGFFTVDYLIGITVHQVKSVSFVAAWKPPRISTDCLQRSIEFRIEPLGRALASLRIPAKGFRVLPLGCRDNARFTHLNRPAVVRERELQAKVTPSCGRHRTRLSVAGPLQSMLRLAVAIRRVAL